MPEINKTPPPLRRITQFLKYLLTPRDMCFILKGNKCQLHYCKEELL